MQYNIKNVDLKRDTVKETMMIGDKNFTFYVNTSQTVSVTPSRAVTGYFLFCNEEKVRLKQEGMRAMPRVLKCTWDGPQRRGQGSSPWLCRIRRGPA